MTRTAWKFLPITLNDLSVYYFRLIFQKFNTNYNVFNRSRVINTLNRKFLFRVYQGKYFVNIYPSIYHVSYKLGMFAKTRKPFFFRSKKKR